MNVLGSTPENISLAAHALREGQLVGMPTETVYGLAASIDQENALRKVFELKARPHDNPLIVHVAHLEQARALTTDFNAYAEALSVLWPGPISLVLKRAPQVSNSVTGGIDTVAIRVPAHPVALRLIDATGVPLAAPSANKFMQLSPTKAYDIDEFIGEELFCILDGGPGEVGLESTVVDCSEGPPRLLRPGGISRSKIEAVLGQNLLGAATERRSPGTYARHYAPKIPLRIAERLSATDAGLSFLAPQNPHQFQLPQEARAFGVSMYASLHKLEVLPISEIVVEAPPTTSDWEAVWDRLRKAATLES